MNKDYALQAANVSEIIYKHDQAKPLLKTTNLTIGYQSKHPFFLKKAQARIIAGPINLELKRGKLVCLLGENGSGKSTLIKTLAGIQAPLSGQVFLESRSLKNLSLQLLATKLSLVLTETVGALNLNVSSLISLGRFPYTGWLGNLSHDDIKKINFAIEAVNLTAYTERLVDELSDGERQRVMLARALAQDTGLIILDEPTAHLDIPNRISLMSLLHRLSRTQQKAILISTHELDLALQIADEIWLFDGLGNLSTGTPEEMVMNGHFSAVFDKTGSLYDKGTGAFKMNLPAGPLIELKGEGIPAFWTRRALERIGFQVTFGESINDIKPVITVRIDDRQGKPGWITVTNEGLEQISYNSISELLAALPDPGSIILTGQA